MKKEKCFPSSYWGWFYRDPNPEQCLATISPPPKKRSKLAELVRKQHIGGKENIRIPKERNQKDQWLVLRLDKMMVVICSVLLLGYRLHVYWVHSTWGYLLVNITNKLCNILGTDWQSNLIINFILLIEIKQRKRIFLASKKPQQLQRDL